MNQCVPSWDIDDTSTPPFPRLSPRSHANSTASDVPMLDYEVAELTWENGQLAMHGLGPPRLPPVKPFSTASPPPSKYTTATTTWVDKLPLNIPRACGTLESIVNQSAATAAAVDHHQLVTWFDNHRATPAAVAPAAAPSTTVAMDALVPCRNQNDDPSSTPIIDSLSVPVSKVFSTRVKQATRVGSCSGAGKGTSVAAAATQNEDILFPKKQTSMARVPTTPEWTSSRSPSVSGTATFGMDSHHVTLDTKTSDHDSVCHSTPHVQRNGGDEEDRKKRSTGKSSISTKRSRAAAIHNQSERKRRDKINQRMKTLQKLVPNSSKTDKASMLDEVIEYLKQLQAQVQMMSRMNMPAMMLPMALQQLQMSMMAPRSMGMGIGMGMGMGMGMDMNTIGLPNITGTPPILHPSAFMPMASWDGSGTSDRLQAPSAAAMPDPMSAFLACQSQPMTMDAYSMMAAMYQQFHQPPASSSKS